MTFGYESVTQNRFFAQSLFRSATLLVDSVVYSLEGLLGVFMIFKFWERLSTIQCALLWLYCLGMFWWFVEAVRLHGRIHELHEAGKLSDVAPDSPLGVTLRVAEKALKSGLHYCSYPSFFLLAFILGILLHQR